MTGSPGVWRFETPTTPKMVTPQALALALRPYQPSYFFEVTGIYY